MTAAENLSKYSGLSWPGGDLACWKQSVCLAHNYLQSGLLSCIHSSADLDTWQVLLDKQQEEHISSPAHRAPANDRAGALPWRSIEMMSVPVVYLYIWSLINVGVDNGAGQTGYWYVGCSSPYIRLSDCKPPPSSHPELELQLGVKIQPMLTDQNYIEILMHCTLILATLRFTDTNANVKEVSTKYSPGNVKHEIKNNKRVLVSTLKFFI